MAQPRSFGGCDTCRTRRVKCDEAWPICAPCNKSRLRCGYNKTIFFDCDETSSNEAKTRFRRPLFDLRTRREMSDRLASAIPDSSSLTQHLTRIDEESLNLLSLEQDGSVILGPFSAMRFASTKSISTLTPETATTNREDGLLYVAEPELSPHNMMTHGNQLPTPCSPTVDDMALLPTDALIQSILDSTEPDLLAHFVNYQDPLFDPDSVLSNNSTLFCPSNFQLSSTELPDLHQGGVPDLIAYNHHSADHHTTPSPGLSFPPIISNSNNALPQDAVFLLQYFSSTIIGFLTPIQNEKTPWHIMFLPHARLCLAQLALNESLDHAGLSAFYGILAISAFSLGGVHQSQMWLDQGASYQKQARQNCVHMLRTAYDVPKKSKYKSSLMALQVMGLLAKLRGDPVQEEYYFLEAEKLIKLRGLGRKSSRKVRLLHHCYALDRIIYESTCMRSIDPKHRHRVCHDVASVSVVSYPEDTMAFRLPNWHNLDEQILRASVNNNTPDDADGNGEGTTTMPDDEEALGLWPGAPYSKISGLPEPWLLLILHAVLLGKEKDSVEQSGPGSSGSIDLGEYLSRAQSLDRCISQYAQQQQQIQQTSITNSSSSAALQNILDAVRYALEIYFFRRIYEVGASWLQDRVVKVRDCLLRCEEGTAGSDSVPSSTGLLGCVELLWASFIASCEAEDSELQESFAGWYKRAARRTGLPCWMNSLHLSNLLWGEKRSVSSGDGGTKVTWIEVLRKQRKLRLQACAAAS